MCNSIITSISWTSGESYITRHSFELRKKLPSLSLNSAIFLILSEKKNHDKNIFIKPFVPVSLTQKFELACSLTFKSLYLPFSQGLSVPD